jgi:hypothetical protein
MFYLAPLAALCAVIHMSALFGPEGKAILLKILGGEGLAMVHADRAN